MIEAQTQLVKKEPAAVEYIPYGGQDKVKMTVAIIQNLIAVKTKSGKTCSERDAIKFMAMCQARRMNPFEGDCFLIGYDGRDSANFALVTAHQTYLKRAELHPEFDGMKSGIIVRDGDTLKELEGDFYDDGQAVVGGWATVFFKTRKQPMHKRLRLSRFQKPFGVWQEDPAGMICKCAEADALRSSFPTMLGGLYLREEIELEPKKPDFSRPIFGTPAAQIATSALESTPENGGGAKGPSDPVAEVGPEAPADAGDTAQQPEAAAPNPLRALRDLLRVAKIKEGKLLEYLASNGDTDGSHGSLEELQLHDPSIVKGVVEKFASIAESIKARG